MRPFFITVCFAVNLALCSAQEFELYNGDTINRKDGNFRKQGKWIVFGKSRPGECWAAGDKVEEGKYVDNKKTGIWFDYHCNGKVKSRITFVNGRPHGPAKLFHENGKIHEEGVWEKNRWVGTYKLFYDNGQVQHEFLFNESGRREGLQKYYHENGQLAIEGKFVNGRESGIIREYHENGELKAEKIYNDGAVDVSTIQLYEPKKPLKKLSDEVVDNAPVVKLHSDEKPNEAALPEGKKLPAVLNGKYTLYNKNRQITKDGIFKDNRFIDGKAYMYNENGILERIAVYENGRYIGDAQVEE